MKKRIGAVLSLFYGRGEELFIVTEQAEEPSVVVKMRVLPHETHKALSTLLDVADWLKEGSR